jgi:hypothetical protein
VDPGARDLGRQKDITVVANDGGAVTECKGGNDKGQIFGVFCKPPT